MPTNIDHEPTREMETGCVWSGPPSPHTRHCSGHCTAASHGRRTVYRVNRPASASSRSCSHTASTAHRDSRPISSRLSSSSRCSFVPCSFMRQFYAIMRHTRASFLSFIDGGQKTRGPRSHTERRAGRKAKATPGSFAGFRDFLHGRRCADFGVPDGPDEAPGKNAGDLRAALGDGHSLRVAGRIHMALRHREIGRRAPCTRPPLSLLCCAQSSCALSSPGDVSAA